MYDIVGFWTAVTLHAGLMLALPLIVVVFLGVIIIEAAIESSSDAKAFVQWVEKYIPHAEITALLGACSLIYWALFGTIWLFMCGESGQWIAPDLVAVLATTSSALAPFVGWIGYVATLLGGLFFAARYISRAIVFGRKVNSHMSDKEKHNV